MKKVIPIPHLAYTVFVIYDENAEKLHKLALKYDKDITLDYVQDTTAFVIPSIGSSCIAFRVDPEEHTTTAAHEVIHVIQNICIDRHINFTKETEHMGYLMQYILAKVIGVDIFDDKLIETTP